MRWLSTPTLLLLCSACPDESECVVDGWSSLGDGDIQFTVDGIDRTGCQTAVATYDDMTVLNSSGQSESGQQWLLAVTVVNGGCSEADGCLIVYSDTTLAPCMWSVGFDGESTFGELEAVFTEAGGETSGTFSGVLISDAACEFEQVVLTNGSFSTTR